MNVIGSKMKQRRKELKMSGATLAKKLGVIMNTVSRWERGERIPSVEKLSSIAAALDVPLNYLLNENTIEEINKELHTVYKVMTIFVYDMREITSCYMSSPEAIGTLGSKEILVPVDIFNIVDSNKPPFAIIMPNDSMHGANMNEKDSVVVNPSEHVNNGDPALVIYNGIPMLRWVCYKSNGDVELQPASPNHRTMIVGASDVQDSNIFTIIGRAVIAMAEKDLKSAF